MRAASLSSLPIDDASEECRPASAAPPVPVGKAVQQLYEGGGKERVGESPVVERDRNPVVSAGFDAGNDRHARSLQLRVPDSRRPEDPKSANPKPHRT